MSARFLDELARKAFDEAIASIEKASSVEVVVSVRRQSGTYRHANVIVGGVVAFAALAAMLFSEHPFSLTSILVDPFLAGLVTGALVELLPGLKRVVTRRRVLRDQVVRAARATFVERGVHGTALRSGLLVYISWLEQQVVLVADRALEQALTPTELARIEAAMTAAMRHGGIAFARELAAMCNALATAMPRHATDVNELPDAIDSDLARSSR